MKFDNKLPIYMQVVDDIRSRIVAGELHAGDKLPSSRELALQYEINPNTAARVYTEMEQRGISYTKRGIGTFVTEDEERIMQLKEEMIEEVIKDFLERTRALGLDQDKVVAYIKKYEEGRS
jgi:DNA-binding transcriptional regulator YhcF (GntR family)